MIRPIALVTAMGLAAGGLVIAPTSAATTIPRPTLRNCSYIWDDGAPTTQQYACLRVSTSSAPAGTVVTFTGTLSNKAIASLATWTGGANDVCLTRYNAKPEKDGSWPWQVLDQACTKVRKDGGFTINVALGKAGPHFYGVQMGQCRGSADLCGNGDDGLVGLGSRRAVGLTTT